MFCVLGSILKTFVLIMLFVNYCFAEVREDICVQYEIRESFNSGWSKKYKVEGIFYDGSELNFKLRTLEFNSFDSYLAVFWDRDEVSLIQLESKYYGSIIGDSYGIDQRGIKWKISDGYMCY